MEPDTEYEDEWAKGEEPPPSKPALSKLALAAKKKKAAEDAEFEAGWGLVPDEAADDRGADAGADAATDEHGAKA